MALTCLCLAVACAVLAEVSAFKLGTCPRVGFSAADALTTTCRLDSDCVGAEKCCCNRNGVYNCVMPVFRPNGPCRTKPGTCPRLEPSVPGVCGSNCAYDSDCPGAHKCCTNQCGALTCAAQVVPSSCPAVVVDPSCVNVWNPCTTDSQCPAGQTCCQSGCGYGGTMCYSGSNIQFRKRVTKH